MAVVVAAVLAVGLLRVLESGGSHPAPKLSPASPAVLSELRAVSPAAEDRVGLPSSVNVPLVAHHQPRLESGEKPLAVYIGAEYCPYCAAERWAVIIAFDRFGTFSGLQETTSSPWDTDGSTATFSFVDARYASPYIDLVMVEHEGNDTHGLDTHRVLQPLTPLESRLWSTSSQRFGDGEVFPFLDLGNTAFVLGGSYDPGALAGLSQRQVAADLSRTSSAPAMDVIGTANYLTAAICSLTAERPAPVCGVRAVREAAREMRLG